MNELIGALNAVKEGGGLVLLALLMFRYIPMVVHALDRNSRALARIEGKLGIPETDRHERKERA